MLGVRIKNNIIVDQEDLDRVNLFTWYIKDNGYVYHTVRPKPRISVYLHQYIIGMPISRDLEIDHINRNRLDNRKENLRFVTHAVNMKNADPGKNYYFDRDRDKWVVQKSIDGKVTYFGSYTTEDEAQRVVNSLRRKFKN